MKRFNVGWLKIQIEDGDSEKENLANSFFDKNLSFPPPPPQKKIDIFNRESQNYKKSARKSISIETHNIDQCDQMMFEKSSPFFKKHI